MGLYELVGFGLRAVVVDDDDVLFVSDDHVDFGSKPPGSLQRNCICAIDDQLLAYYDPGPLLNFPLGKDQANSPRLNISDQ